MLRTRGRLRAAPPLILLLALAGVLAWTSTASAAAPRVLGVGSRGADVAALTQRLAALGYLPAGTRSATFTEATAHAVTAFQKWEGIGRDGRVGPQTYAALRTAVRPEPTTSGRAGKRIEVLLDRQVALLIRDNRVRRVIAVSTGAPGYDTPPGSYRVFRKEVRSWSYPYSVWLPYASYFHRGIAFHGYASVPTYAASHGCVRVPFAFMREVYRFAGKGTPVRVSASTSVAGALEAPADVVYGP
jgi:lipoprotein-anchoring transpeptidase ErfK/SrfK